MKQVSDDRPRTLSTAANALGISEMTLNRWLAKGCPPRTKAGYDIEAIRTWADETLARTRPRLGEIDDKSPLSKAEWSTRREKMAALKLEYQVEQLKGKLVDVTVVKQVMAQHFIELKTHLEQLPDYISSQVRGGVKEKRALRDKVAAKVCDLCDTFKKSLKNLKIGAREDAAD